MPKFIKKILICTMVLGLFTGCSNQEVATTQNDTTVDIVAESTPDTSNESDDIVQDSHYPVTVKTIDYAGNEIDMVFEEAPTKVLAIYQGTIETMIALGLEDHVMASFGLDNDLDEIHQDSLDRMNYDDSVFSPDLEYVVSLQPDFIFSWGSLFSDIYLGDVTTWLERGTNCYISANTHNYFKPNTIEHEYQTILDIGTIFNVEEKAIALVDEMKARVDETLELYKDLPAQNVLAIEYLDGDIRNYSTSTVIGNMITNLGGNLILTDSINISKEELISSDPDVIFVIYMPRLEENGADNIYNDVSLASLSAVQNERVYGVMLGDVYAPTVRTIDGLNAIIDGLY